MADQTVPVNNQAPAMDPDVVKAEESDLLKSIVRAENTGTPESILGDAPELDRSLLEDLAPPKSILLIILKMLFGILVITSIAGFVFFSSQLTSNLDFITSRFHWPNVSAELSSTNAQIMGLQTDLNLHRFQEIKASLDKFSYDSDQYLQQYGIANSSTSTDQEKQGAKDSMVKIKATLKTSLLAAREKFSKSFSAPLIDVNYSSETDLMTLYQEKLRMSINDKIVEANSGTTDLAKINLRNYQQLLKLVGNTELKNSIVQTDFDSLKDEELFKFIQKINSLIVNDVSVVQTIKSKRIKWSDVIDEIKKRTMVVDRNFNENFYKSFGGIRYNSYDFDSSTGKISISGETKSLDPTNFTMIANLIDELNQSKVFSNAAMRSFSKSGSIEEGYLATLRLDLNLKDNPNVTKK